MNYKTRFDKIAKKIGKREKIDGIQRIFLGGSGYIAIQAKGLELTRGCSGELYEIEFKSKEFDWDSLKDINVSIEEWFKYVEEKVDNKKSKKRL